jgi:voltage-gated potassium channel Kch
MLRILLAGLPVILLCLALQAVFVAQCLRYYARYRRAYANQHSQWRDIMLLSMVMLLTLLGNFVQMAIWALLFRVIGEFDDFQTALYHSAVNFVTLGYGDIVMSPRWRLLGALEAANGILMFGLSTAVTTAAVFDVVKFNAARHASDATGRLSDEPRMP